MFALLVLMLTLMNVDHKAFEDCTIRIEAPAPTQLILAVQEFNDIPDAYRSC
jgi:hypothetical protein